MPELKTRVETEVRQASETIAGETTDNGLPVQPWNQLAPGDLLDDVIRGDHLYRIAVQDIRLADIQREDAKWKPWPRLMAQGWMEIPVENESSDTYLSGGLYLRFDLVRAILYKNAVTVAEVMQSVNQQQRLDAANAATVLFLKRAIELRMIHAEQEHQRRAHERIALAEADGESLFKAGKLPSAQWYTWKRRRVENETEAERLAVRWQKAQREMTQSYRGAQPLQGVLHYADQLINEIPASPAAADEKVSSVLMRSPRVTRARLALFLSEVSILEARLKWLPSVSLDLGGGKIPVRGDDGRGHEGVVPAVGASMTLYDFGEITRGVQRAEIETTQARERMLQAVEAAHSDLEAVGRQKQYAQAMAESAEKQCAAVQRMAAEIKALMEVGKMSVMDVHETEWMLLDAEAQRDRCRNECRLAVVEERLARNEVLDDERQTRIFWGYANKKAGQQE